MRRPTVLLVCPALFLSFLDLLSPDPTPIRLPVPDTNLHCNGYTLIIESCLGGCDGRGGHSTEAAAAVRAGAKHVRWEDIERGEAQGRPGRKAKNQALREKRVCHAGGIVARMALVAWRGAEMRRHGSAQVRVNGGSGSGRYKSAGGCITWRCQGGSGGRAYAAAVPRVRAVVISL